MAGRATHSVSVGPRQHHRIFGRGRERTRQLQWLRLFVVGRGEWESLSEGRGPRRELFGLGCWWALYCSDSCSRSLLKKPLPVAWRSVVRSRDARRRSAAANRDVQLHKVGSTDSSGSSTAWGEEASGRSIGRDVQGV